MAKLAYLDSARMGLMSERSRQAHIDYIRLAGTEGCSLYFEQLLKSGFASWPIELGRQFPGLADWRGTAELKSTLRRMVAAPADSPVLLANRSSQLMQLAARALTENTRRLLVTDLIWPGYRSILERHRQPTGVGITTVALRDAILRDHATVSDVVTLIASRYESMRCDCVFLPAVSHLGIRLPLDGILSTLRRIRRPHFVVIDGAQALGHISEWLGINHCDFLVAGCHKWLQGHVPMGVGFCPSQESSRRIESICQIMSLAGELDDALMRFVEQLATDELDSFGETVNLASLFSTRAALAAKFGGGGDISASFRIRRENAEALANSLPGTGWAPLLPRQPFRSGVLLLQLNSLHALSAKKLREMCLLQGLAVTAYECGLIRIAMPDTPWGPDEVNTICRALSRISGIRKGPRETRCNLPMARGIVKP